MRFAIFAAFACHGLFSVESSAAIVEESDSNAKSVFVLKSPSDASGLNTTSVDVTKSPISVSELKTATAAVSKSSSVHAQTKTGSSLFRRVFGLVSKVALVTGVSAGALVLATSGCWSSLRPDIPLAQRVAVCVMAWSELCFTAESCANLAAFQTLQGNLASTWRLATKAARFR